MRKSNKFTKIMSMLLAISMLLMCILPVSVFADDLTATAIASTIENGDGVDRTDIIKITFSKEVTFDDTNWSTDIIVTDGTTTVPTPNAAVFGTDATAEINSETQKDITITLGTGHAVTDGVTLAFTNSVVSDSTNPTDVFNDSIIIGGSFNPATVNYIVDPSAATVTVDGYSTLPTSLGVGTYTYSATYENYKSIVSETFEISESDLNTTKDVTIALEKEDADYTVLDAKIQEASSYNEDGYTADSFAVLKTALENANKVDRALKFDEQSTINGLVSAISAAISGLVPVATVDFMAVGVCEDVDANYGKATKVVIVFDEPIDANANKILENLSVKNMVESAEWTDADNTVLTLKLKADANLENVTSITLNSNSDIKTKLNSAILNTKSVDLTGNFVGAEDMLTANIMTATIVKESNTPVLTKGDKIVIVFNAPLKDTPSTIEVNGMTANVVAGTSNTVYQIELTGSEALESGMNIKYGSMSTTLSGTFGQGKAPKVTKAYILDNNGTGAIEGDNIIIQFDTPTNGANDVTKISVKGNGYIASLGSSTIEWDETKTQLVITLASDAVVKDGIEIDLTGLGIKDMYETLEADASSLKQTVSGSFGFTVQPRIVKAIAFTQGNYDCIRVFFNTAVAYQNPLEKEETPTFTNGFNMGYDAKFNLEGEGGDFTYYEIKMNQSQHSVLKDGTTIKLSGLVDAETKTKSVSDSFEISGAFMSPIKPEILNVVALSENGSGIAKKGDRVLVIFNTEVTEGEITLLNNRSFGDGFKKELAGNIMEITLGENPTIEIGSEIKFEGFKDGATLSETIDTVTLPVGGSFGKVIEPKIISATAISLDGTGIPKAGDKIVVVFNKTVKIDGVECSYYEYELTNNLENYTVGKEFKINVVNVDTDKEVTLSCEIGGSYGLETMPSVKSVVLSGSKGIETITVVFDRATNMPNLSDETKKKILLDNNKHIASESDFENLALSWNSDGTILTIKLTSTATTATTENDKLDLSGLGILSADTGKEIDNINSLEISGTLYPTVEKVYIDEKDGKTLVVKFSTRTNGDLESAKAAVKNMKVIFGSSAVVEWAENNTELRITMSDDHTMSDSTFIVLNSFNILDGFSKTFKVVGQYKIDTEKLIKKTLNITSVFVRANNTENAPRTDFTKGQKGDNIIVRFEDSTNKTAGSDAKENVEVATGGKFGENYTAVWDDDKTIIITLGDNASVTTSSTVKIKDVKFANETGYLAVNGANEVVKTLTGQFDGRKYWIVNPEKNTVNGRVRVVGMINKADITSSKVLNPYVICQAYNQQGAVISINALSIGDVESSNVVFDFDSANLAKIKLFVLGGDYTDPSAIVTAYSETIEK